MIGWSRFIIWCLFLGNGDYYVIVGSDGGFVGVCGFGRVGICREVVDECKFKFCFGDFFRVGGSGFFYYGCFGWGFRGGFGGGFGGVFC